MSLTWPRQRDKVLRMDIFSREKRSRIMSAIRSKDTKPEMTVRRIAHGMGYRYRLHRKDLPGKPDLVFSRRRAVIFVHGCFWHQHDCRDGRVPTANITYWQTKLARNVQRDEQSHNELESLGWRVLTLWECELKEADNIKARLRDFLGPK